jgi:hypothetical protein
MNELELKKKIIEWLTLREESKQLRKSAESLQKARRTEPAPGAEYSKGLPGDDFRPEREDPYNIRVNQRGFPQKFDQSKQPPPLMNKDLRNVGKEQQHIKPPPPNPLPRQNSSEFNRRPSALPNQQVKINTNNADNADHSRVAMDLKRLLGSHTKKSEVSPKPKPAAPIWNGNGPKLTATGFLPKYKPQPKVQKPAALKSEVVPAMASAPVVVNRVDSNAPKQIDQPNVINPYKDIFSSLKNRKGK